MVPGVMGGGDSTCALAASRRFLDVKLVTDCPTKAPLVLTVHNADPYDATFQSVREERTETLSAHVVLPLQTKQPLTLTPRIKQLRLQVEVACKEGDKVVMRYGDARCDVPPAKDPP
jgi:P pilus assembly chaperone PapD